MRSAFASLLAALGATAISSPQGTEAQPNSISDLLPGHCREAVPFGPKPAGCSDFEVLIGELLKHLLGAGGVV
jgi:hypothetical protein